MVMLSDHLTAYFAKYSDIPNLTWREFKMQGRHRSRCQEMLLLQDWRVHGAAFYSAARGFVVHYMGATPAHHRLGRWMSLSIDQFAICVAKYINLLTLICDKIKNRACYAWNIHIISQPLAYQSSMILIFGCIMGYNDACKLVKLFLKAIDGVFTGGLCSSFRIQRISDFERRKLAKAWIIISKPGLIRFCGRLWVDSS